MSTSCIHTLRHFVRQSPAPYRICQRRWARVQEVRHLATHRTQERVLAKYKTQLEEKAREKGLKDIAELQQAYKDEIDRLRKQAAVPGATAPLTPPPDASDLSASTPSSTSKSPWPSPPPLPTPQTSPSASSPPPPGIKTLHSFLDLAKIVELPSKEVEALWRRRHVSNPQSLHFSLPSRTFDTLLDTAKQNPAFVLPLPRQVPAEQTISTQTQQVAELHYLQFAHPHPETTTLLFTTLAEFKLKGEFAAPHTTITFHSELADSHNIVLGQGIVQDNRGVSIDDARWLVMCMQKFYVIGEGSGKQGELLKMFTKGDGRFSVDKLLEEAEKLV